MPATIVPINLTRSYSLRNPDGLRYGNFEGMVHLPPLSKSSKPAETGYSKFNNQQIYRTVCEWFESWRAWQQRTVLYGIVDRCNIRQLDILSTTLEPVRHRDYSAAYKMRYPSSPFKTRPLSRSLSRLDSMQSKASRSSRLKMIEERPIKAQQDDSSSVTASEAPSVPRKIQAVEVQHVDLDKILDTDSSIFDDSTSQDETSTRRDSLNSRRRDNEWLKEENSDIGQLAVIKEMVIVSKDTVMPPLETFADNLATDILKDAIEEVGILEKYIKSKENNEGYTSNKKIIQQESSNIQNSQYNQSAVFNTPMIERNIVPSLKRSQSVPKDMGNVRIMTPRTLEASFIQEQIGLTRSMSQKSRRSASDIRYQLFGSRTTVSTPDFFSRTGLIREGSMQREIRFGAVKRPNKIQDIPISLQRSFKGVKWWPEEPKSGKVFVKAKKQDLASNYKEQLQQIWTWLELWEDYEKINLMKEILKLANAEVLSTLYHYTHQKLRDARDINRLSDKLLLYIFSFLSPKDIRSASQVCRRWRYLCASDSLWMIKCHELGVMEGILNMEELVLKANTKSMGIDWRLAYEELRRITAIMKYEAEMRAKALLEEAERIRKIKEAQEESVHFDLMSEKSVSIVLDSRDIIQQYKKLFHYDEYTPVPSSSVSAGIFALRQSQTIDEESSERRLSTGQVELEIKRATQSALEREEHKKKIKELEKKRGKYSVRLKRIPMKEENEDSDVVSNVSSEDLSDLRDFIFEGKEDDEEEEEGEGEELVRTHPPLFWKALTPSSQKEKPRELEKIQKDQQKDFVKRTKEEKEKKLKEEQERLLEIERERFRSHKSKTEVRQLISMVKQKPQKKNRDEFAFDVRTDLHQASDLLGKSAPTLHLEWKKSDDDVTEYQLAVQRYMGVVKSVRRVRKLEGHMNGVVALWFDQKRLITAGLDRTVRLWDIRSGKSIHKFYGHKGGIRCLQFEGNTLLTGSWDTTIIVWDLRTFEKRMILSEHRGCVSCIHINHVYVFSGSHDCTVRVWHRTTFAPVKVIQGHKAGVNCLAYDGTYLVSGASDMTLRLVHLKSEECLHVFKNGQDQVLSVVLQGDLIISSDIKGHVYFWNRETGESEAAIQAHDAPINKLIFHKGRFFTASGDNTIREWDLLTMTSVRLLQGHKAPVRDVKVTDDRIVTCSDDGTVRIWDLFDSKKTLKH